MKNIIALQTARAGSKSIIKKNIIKIRNKPLFLYPLIAANKCKLINKVYCSTDDKVIKKYSQKFNYKIIDRPKSLSGDKANHLTVMRHAIKVIEKKNKRKIDIIIILLGNAIGLDNKTLTEAIKLLKNNDCVASVSQFNMFNPYRAFIKKKLLRTFLPQKLMKNKNNTNDKNTLGNIYFCNGNFWVCKRENFFMKKKTKQFPWMGNKIVPYIQNTFLELDSKWQLDYVKKSLSLFKGKIK